MSIKRWKRGLLYHYKTQLIKLKLTSSLLNAILLRNFHLTHFFLAIHTKKVL